MIGVQRLDHLSLTVIDIDATCEFYERALGLQTETAGNGRRALWIGAQKINLHRLGDEPQVAVQHPTPGSGHLCFLTSVPVDDVAAHLESLGVKIEIGPVPRAGAQSALHSIYFRDPDGNLIEVANEVA